MIPLFHLADSAETGSPVCHCIYQANWSASIWDFPAFAFPLDVREMVSQTVLCCDWLYMASGDLNSGPHPACLPSPDPSSKSMTIAPEPTVGASKTVAVNKTVNLGKVTG